MILRTHARCRQQNLRGEGRDCVSRHERHGQLDVAAQLTPRGVSVQLEERVRVQPRHALATQREEAANSGFVQGALGAPNLVRLEPDFTYTLLNCSGGV